MTTRNASSSGQGGNNGNHGNSAPRNGRGGNVTYANPFDSDSDSDAYSQRPSGGAKLNGSPYKPPHRRVLVSTASSENSSPYVPPHRRAAAAAASTATSSTNDFFTPQRPQPTGVLATTTGNTFQRGDPTPLDVFASNASSSTGVANVPANVPVTTGASSAPIATGVFSAPIATGAPRAFMPVPMRPAPTAPATHIQAAGRAHAAPMHRQPSAACVFIANLPKGKPDESLKAEVSRTFAPHGYNTVRIKRDDRGMPFGFIQFLTNEAAAAAVSSNQNVRVFGRSCRVELARATRTFVVHRRDHHDIQVADVIPLVMPYGEVSVVERLRPDIAELMDMPNAIYVEFAVFDSDRDIVSHFRTNRTFRVTQFDIKKLFREPPRNMTDEEYLAAYYRDRKSVWVGGLSLNVTEMRLRRLFEQAGDVVRVQVVQRFYKPFASFAFVEFARLDMPLVAINMFDAKQHFGVMLFVERKLRKLAPPRRINAEYVRQVTGRGSNIRSGDAQSGGAQSGGAQSGGAHPGGAQSGGSHLGGVQSGSSQSGGTLVGGPQPANRGWPTPRRVVTADPGSHPFLEAQIGRSASRVVNTGSDYVPAIRVTPHHDQPREATSARSASSTAPVVITSRTITPDADTVPTTTPGGGLAVPSSTLSAMAPPFGPGGYFIPSPVGMFPFGSFHPAMYGYNPVQTPDNQMQAFGAQSSPFNQGFHQPGFFAPQVSYYQDTTTGLIYAMPAPPPPPIVDHTMAMGQRSVSAMPILSATEQLAITHATSPNPAAEQRTTTPGAVVQQKKSVTFADPIAETASSSSGA